MFFYTRKNIGKLLNFVLYKYYTVIKKYYTCIAIFFVLASPITLRIDIVTRYFPAAIKIIENPENLIKSIDSSPLFIIIISIALFLTKSKFITIVILKTITIVCIYYSIKYLEILTKNSWFVVTTPVFLTYYVLPVQNTYAIPFLLKSYIEFLEKNYKRSFILLFIATLFRFELIILYPIYFYHLIKEKRKLKDILISVGIFILNILILLPFVENYVSKYNSTKNICLSQILFFPVRFFGITDFLKVKHIFFLIFNIVAFISFFFLLKDMIINVRESTQKIKSITIVVILFSFLLSINCVGYLAVGRVVFYIYPFIFKKIENKNKYSLISLLFLIYSLMLILGYWYFAIKVILKCKPIENFIYSKELLEFYCDKNFSSN